MRIHSGEPLTDGRGLAKNFILKQVTLTLKLCPHLNAEGIHLTAEGGHFATHGRHFEAKGIQLSLCRLLRKLHLFLHSIDLHSKRLQVWRNDILEELPKLGDNVPGHMARVR